MITFLYVLYVMVCLFLILVVLLQAGRGGMGAAFGGGSSQTVFGGSGAGNFLTRLTVISAALFMMLSAALTYVSSSGEKSLEKASERIRLREEARGEVSEGATGDKAAADGEKNTSEAPSSSPEGALMGEPGDAPSEAQANEATAEDKGEAAEEELAEPAEAREDQDQQQAAPEGESAKDPN